MKSKKEIKENKKNKNKIKAIVFDVCGVLQLGKYSQLLPQREYSGIHHSLAKKFGIDIDSWFDSIDRAYSNSIEGKIDEKKAIRVISKNLDVNDKRLEKIIIKTYRAFFKKNKKLYDLSYNLKRRGYVVGILSDQWPLSKKALISNRDYKLFDPVVISCDVGLRKPDMEIYKLLVSKIKLKNNKIKNEEILFVDNREWNLIPAKKLGMRVILFLDNNQLFRELVKMNVLNS